MKYIWELLDFKTGKRAYRFGREYIIAYSPYEQQNSYYLIDVKDGMLIKTQCGKMDIINALNDLQASPFEGKNAEAQKNQP